MLVNPPPDRVLKEGDEIILIGSDKGEEKFTRRYVD